MANQFIFDQPGGINSLRIKNAIVDSMLPNAFQNLTTNIARNPGFFESVARQLASSYLPVRGVENVDQLGEERWNEIDSNGINISFSIDDQPEPIDSDPLSPSYGFFLNANIIPNLELTSTFIKRNFFDSTQDITDTIVIDIPIASVNVSYSNKFVESSPIGFAGSIKEDVGSSNYKISIEGVFLAKFLGDDAALPDQNRPDVREFVKMCVRNKVITINNDWLENKSLIDLSQCVVKSFALPNDNTMKNIQRFSMQLESDKLILID